MGFPRASQSSTGVAVVTEPHRNTQKSATVEHKFPSMTNLIVLDSDDELEEPNHEASLRPFGATRDKGKSAFRLGGHKNILSSVTSESRIRENSRKRVLAVEDVLGSSEFDNKSFQVSPSFLKRNNPWPEVKSTSGDPKSGVQTEGTEPNGIQLPVKANKKRKDTFELIQKLSGGIPESAKQDDKENNGFYPAAENGAKAGKTGRKRRKESDTNFSTTGSPNSEIPLAGLAPAEDEDVVSCHQPCGDAVPTEVQRWNSPVRGSNWKKTCNQKYCERCLNNRYGECLADIQDHISWRCPRCRDICNCSCCMKKKGLAATGILAKQARAAGYSSVAQLLEQLPGMQKERFTHYCGAATTSAVKSVPVSLPVSNATHLPCGSAQVEDDSDVFQEERKSRKYNDQETSKPNLPSGGSVGNQTKKREKKKKSKVDLHKVGKTQGSLKQVQVTNGEKQDEAAAGEVSKKKKSKRKKHREVNLDEESVKGEGVSGSPLVAQGVRVNDSTADIQEDEPEEPLILPAGSLLEKVGGVDIPEEMLGMALQFAEFCSAFDKPLKLKKSKAQKVLSEMLSGGTLRKGGQSDLVQIHVLLLSVIFYDVEDYTNVTMSATSKNLWVYHLERHLSEQYRQLKKVPEVEGGQEEGGKNCRSASASDISSLPLFLWPFSDEDMVGIVNALKNGLDGYAELSLMTRLQLLTILCDDALNTKKLRDYIESSVSNHENEQKETREELFALKKQAKEIHENDVKEIMVAKQNNVDLSSRDHTKVQRELEKLSEREVELTETAARLCGPRCDALRTEPAAVHSNDGRFWRLKGAGDRQLIVLQVKEAWFVYTEEQVDEVEQCIRELNARKKSRPKITRKRKKKSPVRVEISISPTEAKDDILVIDLSD